jgi:CRP-like cAMP-binding protein
MDTLVRILEEHPFFDGLDPAYLETIAGCATNARFEAGEFIFREGEAADKVFLIRQGNVALEVFTPNRGAIVIQTLDPGEILGWSWLIPPYQWRFDARATDLTRAIVIDGRCLRPKCEENHDLGYELLKRFSVMVGQRLDATRLQLIDIYGVPI